MISVYRLTVQSDGRRSMEVVGSNVVALSDGTQFVVDLNTLEDPDGNRYAILGDSHQQSEGGAILHEARIIRHTPVFLSDKELQDSYLQGKPEATTDELAAFAERRAYNSELPAS